MFALSYDYATISYMVLNNTKNMLNYATYERELSILKPHDEVQFSEDVKGFQFIVTAGHGYLVVPHGHAFGTLANSVYEASGYGFNGKLATYLEEDCEASTFLGRMEEFATA